jgi:hypothetical protein
MHREYIVGFWDGQDKMKETRRFAARVAGAIKKISSSHCYFIMQQAYGEDLSWEDVVKTRDTVIKECAARQERKNEKVKNAR